MLSAVDTADIVDRADLASDADWDVFEYSGTAGDGGGCSPSGGDRNNVIEITRGEIVVPDGRCCRKCCSSYSDFADCYRTERSGYHFYSSLIRDTISVRAPGECSDECRRTTYCKSFSYRCVRSYYLRFMFRVHCIFLPAPRRYGGITSPNCFLSGVDARDLLTTEDLVADQGGGGDTKYCFLVC